MAVRSYLFSLGYFESIFRKRFIHQETVFRLNEFPTPKQGLIAV